MKIVQSILGFKQQRSPVLEARNSVVKLIFYLQPLNILFLFLVNHYIPQPYMDQQFHENQFAAYEQQNYSYWNGKITTPPGLYYITLLFSWVGRFGMSSLAYLRFINTFLFGNVTLVFFLKIFQEMDLNQNNTSRSINLMLTPTLFFFNFLAYTDALSLMLMTMAFYYNLVNSRKRLFLFSMLSVFVRQNNIIWLGYLACYRIVLDQKQLFGNDRSILSHAITLVKTILTKKVYILKQFKYQLFLLTLFIGYLYKFNNGRLLFGDVTNHPVSFYPTQILYFALFATLNLPLTIREFLFTWTNVIRRLYYSRHALSTWLFLLSISIVFVDIYTIVHPFTLSDNRHYVFYIYKDIISKPFFRYGLCLVYSSCIVFLFRLIVNSQIKLVRFMLHCAFTFIVLSISSLVEFRYFTIPLVYLSFELCNRRKSLDIEGIHWHQTYGTLDRMYPSIICRVLFNIAIMYVFIYRPFGPENSRFMW